jgi:trans-AT polyketide synthase/acyltransferase/oxidoreductase domain-containing protein
MQQMSVSLNGAIASPELPVRLFREKSGAALKVALEAGNSHGCFVADLPGIFPESLGSGVMAARHGTRYPYICGEMANGIATVEMVAAMASQEMLGFFGAAGLSIGRTEKALAELALLCGERAWGTNLIHSPSDPEHEEETVNLYLRHRVRRVSASAFMAMRPGLVRYSATGLRQRPDGSVHRKNHLFAKVSRAEVARHFLSPPPAAMLDALVASGSISAEEGRLARLVPVAEQITVEADSGGHTDNRPLTVLLPAILALADELREHFG